MNEIEELEQVIKNLDESMESSERRYSAYTKLMVQHQDSLAELKKSDEVKPVFPKDGYRCDVNGQLIETINSNYSAVGEVFNKAEEATGSHKRKKARKYIIEAINKANKGNNGFKARCFNFYIGFSHNANKLYITSNMVYQTGEGKFYIRKKSEAERLFMDDEFISNCKIYFEVKS